MKNKAVCNNFSQSTIVGESLERVVALAFSQWHNYSSRDTTEECCMAKIDQLKIEIEQLPEEQLAELIRWLSEKDWARWDREIEADSRSRKLDFLIHEAEDAKSKGKLSDL
jgi:hypothetical protein